MTVKASKLPWSVPLRREDVPDNGLHRDLTADEATRAAVAAIAGVRGLPSLQASFDVSRQGEGLKVMGEVSAIVEQTCVVSLEPMRSELRESIDLVFMPEAPPIPELGEMPQVDPGAPEAPEPLVNGTADLGAVATEFLLLGIDPYPRKPDAIFESPGTPEDAASHPFAALAKLKAEPPKR